MKLEIRDSESRIPMWLFPVIFHNCLNITNKTEICRYTMKVMYELDVYKLAESLSDLIYYASDMWFKISNFQFQITNYRNIKLGGRRSC